MNAPRAIGGDLSFPTVGHYFIRGIRKLLNKDGKECLYASVNWRLNEEEAWQDMIETNRFWLNLDFLFTSYSLKPNVAPADLLHQFVRVNTVKIRESKYFNPQTSIYTDWDIIDYSDNLLEALPYSNMLSRFILAWEDEKLDRDVVNDFAVSMAEDDDIAIDDEIQEDNIDL